MGGYNSCYAETQEEALSKAQEMGARCHLEVAPGTLREVSEEEMMEIDRSWAASFD